MAVVSGKIDRSIRLAVCQVAVRCEARYSVVRNNGIADGSIVDGHHLKFDAIILVILDGIADNLDILNMGTGRSTVLSAGVDEDPYNCITLDGYRC